MNIMIRSVLVVCSFIKFSTGSLCVRSENEPPVCTSPSTWAVNSVVNITHDFTPTIAPPFNVRYELASSILCEIAYTPGDNCIKLDGQNCGLCQNNYASDTTIVAEMNAVNLTTEKNGSTLVYTTASAGISDKPLHTFTLAVCPQDVGNASMKVDADPCGYGCTGQLGCRTGFHLNPTIGLNETYVCSATAEWDPSVPLKSCIPDYETTTTEPATTPAVPATSTGSATDTTSTTNSPGFTKPGAPDTTSTTYSPGFTKPDTTSTTYSPGFTKPDDDHYYPNSGPVLAGIGGALAVACIVLFVYMICNNIDISNKIILYVMSILCLCVWAIALGLCFGKSNDKSTVIAGIVLGSLALVGMVVIAVFQIMQITSQKN